MTWIAGVPSVSSAFDSPSTVTPISTENNRSPDWLLRALATRSMTDTAPAATLHRRTSSLTFATALVRRSSRRRASQPRASSLTINTLPIIQPETHWDPYEPGSRCFQINLNNPRQQVTSILALSTVPRPATPPFDEFESGSAIITATQAAMEDEATEEAIAASLVTHAAEEARWAVRPVHLSPLAQTVSCPDTIPEMNTNIREIFNTNQSFWDPLSARHQTLLSSPLALSPILL